MNAIASNQNFIIAAYGLTWLVLVAYTVYLVRRGRRTSAEASRLASAEVRS